MRVPAPAPDLSSLLRKAELFSSLLDDDLAYVASRTESLVLKAGEPVFRQGEDASRFFIIEAGEVAIYQKSAEGREGEVARYVQGDSLGDFEFAVGARFSGAARAELPSSLLVFPGGGRTQAELLLERPDTMARIRLRAAAIVSARLRSTQALISHNSPWVRELRRQIYTDPGTGLWSKAFLDEELPRSVEKPSSILLLKPDRFKDLNDAHGHSAGDAAMERIAAILSSELARLGRGWALRLRSNETALVLPRCGAGEAIEIARSLRSAIGGLDLGRAIPGCTFRFSLSLALATWPEDGAEWRRLVDDAYAVLNRAWADGGDRVYRLKPRGEASP